MSKFTVLDTYHTGMVVADVEWTVGFFRDVLGFELLDISPREIKNQSFVSGVPGADPMIAYMKCPGHLLEIAEYRNPPDLEHYRPRMVDVGHFHINLTVDDINAAVEACQAYDQRIESLSPSPLIVDSGPNKGNQVIMMRLPDGVMVEFGVRS